MNNEPTSKQPASCELRALRTWNLSLAGAGATRPLALTARRGASVEAAGFLPGPVGLPEACTAFGASTGPDHMWILQRLGLDRQGPRRHLVSLWAAHPTLAVECHWSIGRKAARIQWEFAMRHALGHIRILEPPNLGAWRPRRPRIARSGLPTI